VWKVPCVCDCGTQKLVDVWQITRGRIKSCGCLLREMARDLAYKHGGELSLVLLQTATNGDAFVIKLPRIKLGGASKDDPATGGTVQTIPFTALKYVGNGAYENSTIVLQDSTLS
jgi:hypothetical protein